MINSVTLLVVLAVGAEDPKLPGQDTFGAIQEIVTLLDADQRTDWSRVDISALREHLVDMNRLFLDAEVAETKTAFGLEMRVTGAGRTLAAIRRMVPAHSNFLEASVRSSIEPLADGIRWVVASDDPDTRTRLHGLGFFGLMATGSHHQAHHLAIARGESHPMAH